MRRPPTIYLAGPILDCTDPEVEGWRKDIMDVLPTCAFLDPMRRDYRGVQDEHITEIVEEDKLDIDASDVVLAYCWKASWGTAMEIFYANEQEDTLVISVVPEGQTISPWVAYHSDRVFRTLGEAVELIEKKYKLD